jgi:hypothetical protein
MNIRYMLVIGEEGRGYHAVRVSDGMVLPLDKSIIAQPGLIKFIEENQGEKLTWQT